MKEIHFYMDFPFDPVNTFKTYDGTKYAIEKGREIINTTSIANISFDLLDLGYRIFAAKHISQTLLVEVQQSIHQMM